MTQPTASDTPRSLRPTPELVDDNVQSLSPKDYVRSQEDAYNAYLAELRHQGKDFKVDNATGTIKIRDNSAVDAAKAAAAAYADSKGYDDLRKQQMISSAAEDAANSEYTPDPIGSQYLTSLNDAELELKRAAEDAAEAKRLQGSVKSYAASEQDKSAEITRQFKDFDARADSLYNLMDAEQSYGMNADDQNIQNMKAQRDLGMAITPGGYYTKPYMQDSLSSILAPSLPSYVRPDYRQNASVGLPGPQGFDDPQYDQYGMPAYAMGTDPTKPREIFWPWGNK